MSIFEVQTIDHAPEGSRAPLEKLQQTFGMVPNVAGVIANSPVLANIFVPLFQGVHSGTFTEAEIHADTPIVKAVPKDFLATLSPMGSISEAKDIADAVIYLTEARHVTGEVRQVDGGTHVGKMVTGAAPFNRKRSPACFAQLL